MKLDHLTLLASSMEQSMPYYDALLPLVGLTKTRDHVWTDGDGFFIQFLPARSGTGPYERYGPGLNHVGFGARSAEAVDAVRAKMQEAGYPVPDVQDLDGVKALFMRDPDGVRFEISYYPPGTSIVD
jgi:lactoylglutathione lyase